MKDDEAAKFAEIVQHPQLRYLGLCNAPVPAWKFVQPMRCNKRRGHAGECDHLSTEGEG